MPSNNLSDKIDLSIKTDRSRVKSWQLIYCAWIWLDSACILQVIIWTVAKNVAYKRQMLLNDFLQVPEKSFRNFSEILLTSSFLSHTSFRLSDGSSWKVWVGVLNTNYYLGYIICHIVVVDYFQPVKFYYEGIKLVFFPTVDVGLSD